MQASTLDDLRPRGTARLSGPALLALCAHGLLVLALSFAVSWHTSEPTAVEAELWSAVPQAAAPRATAPPPEPEPPKPQPKPQPQPETKPEPPPNRDADIAREKLEEKKRLDQQRQDDERKEVARKKAEDAKKAELAKREAEQDAAQKKAEAAAQAAQQKKAEAAQTARAEALRKQQLDRMMAQAGETGSGGTGTAAQSSGPSASYAGLIAATIKPYIVFSDDAPANPQAEVEVRLAPNGSIVGRRLTHSSGIQSWDDAVLRAIDKTAMLPLDRGKPPPAVMVLGFRPRDL